MNVALSRPAVACAPMQWAADRLHDAASWGGDRVHDLAQLSTDQRIAFTGVIITALSVGLAAMATKYARDAVREGRKALEVARDSAREQRSARRVDDLQRLFGPLHDLKRAAATATPNEAEGAQALHSARTVVEALLRPFAPTDLLSCRKAVEEDLAAQARSEASEAALVDLQKSLDAEVATLQAFRGRNEP